MTLEAVTRTIQFILAPVFMVSTCSVLLGNLLSRYATINNSLRSLAREYRTLTHTDAPTTPEAAPAAPAARTAALRLHEIEAQMPSLLQRHALMRRSVLLFNHAILVFFVDMLVIAVAALEAAAVWATGVALLIFLVGIAVATVGLWLSTQEARSSQLAVLHDVAWFAGTAGAGSRAGTRRADTAPLPGTFPYNPLVGADETEHPGVA